MSILVVPLDGKDAPFYDDPHKMREVGTASSGDHNHPGNPGHVGGSRPSFGITPEDKQPKPSGKKQFSNLVNPKFHMSPRPESMADPKWDSAMADWDKEMFDRLDKTEEPFSVRTQDMGVLNNSGDILVSNEYPISQDRIQGYFNRLSAIYGIPPPTVNVVEHMSGRSGETMKDGTINLGERGEGNNWRVALHEYAHWLYYNLDKEHAEATNDEHDERWQHYFADVVATAAKDARWKP